MKVCYVIKAGKHAPPWYLRLLHIRFWLLFTPKGFTITNLVISARHGKNWICPFHCTSFGKPLNYFLNAYQQEMKSKAGGINWGIPGKTKNGWSNHPNSIRLTFDMLENLWDYRYIKGEHTEAKAAITAKGFRAIRQPTFSRWFAYFTGGWVGGDKAYPFDVRISYTIKPFWK